MSAPSIFGLDMEWGVLMLLHEDAITDVDIAAVMAWIAEHEDKFDEKLERCRAFIAERRALANAAETEAHRLLDLAEVREKQADRLEEIIKRTFELRGIKKRELRTGSFAVQANGGKQALKVNATIEQLKKIDPALVKVIPAKEEPNNEEIRARLEAGVSIPECELAPRGSRLVIK